MKYLFLLLALSRFATAQSSDLLLPLDLAALPDNWGYINPEGRFVAFPTQSERLHFVNGISRAAIDNRWGLVDKEGNVVREFKYCYIVEHSHGGRLLAQYNIHFNYNYEFIDSLLNVVVPASENKYKVEDFNGDIALVCFDGDEDESQYAFYKQGKELFNQRFINASGFENGMARVKIDPGNEPTYYRWIDTCGNKVLGDFISANDFIENMAMVACNVTEYSYHYHYKWIDRTGKTVLGPYRDADDFYGPLAPVENQDRKWGFINRKGEMVVGYKYDMVSFPMLFVNGDCISKVGCSMPPSDVIKKGVIDSTGTEIFPCIYEEIYQLEPVLVLKKNGLCALATLTGDIVTPFVYDYIVQGYWGDCWEGITPYDYVNAVKNGMVSILDLQGNVIVPPIYQEIKYIRYKGMAYVKKNNKWGIIYENEKVFIPCVYDEYVEDVEESELCFRKDKTWLFFDFKGNFLRQTNSDPWGWCY